MGKQIFVKPPDRTKQRFRKGKYSVIHSHSYSLNRRANKRGRRLFISFYFDLVFFDCEPNAWIRCTMLRKPQNPTDETYKSNFVLIWPEVIFPLVFAINVNNFELVSAHRLADCVSPSSLSRFTLSSANTLDRSDGINERQSFTLKTGNQLKFMLPNFRLCHVLTL